MRDFLVKGTEEPHSARPAPKDRPALPIIPSKIVGSARERSAFPPNSKAALSDHQKSVIMKRVQMLVSKQKGSPNPNKVDCRCQTAADRRLFEYSGHSSVRCCARYSVAQSLVFERTQRPTGAPFTRPDMPELCMHGPPRPTTAIPSDGR